MPTVKKIVSEQFSKFQSKVRLKFGFLRAKKSKKCPEEKTAIALPNEIWSVLTFLMNLFVQQRIFYIRGQNLIKLLERIGKLIIL